ncbi:uncharacterized protein [Henckelia pumila]|uniref:uncharacterized protein n=1 Tax=Henckelia pumila TaxID=405737 RepID=UPI003C6EA423
MAAYDLMNQKQHIETCLVKQSSQVAADYRVRLTASIYCIRFLVRQGLPFRGHDESRDSLNHVVAENHMRISTFFDVVAQLRNIVGASCKRRDILREKQFENVIEGICNDDILTGRVIDMHLMKNILAVTNDLSQALQIKDQDIVNAIIHSPRTYMEKLFVFHGRSRRNTEGRTNIHYFRVETFYEVIDLQLHELNNRFNEMNTELLLCMACLDPSNSFSAYDKGKLLQFAHFYPSDFSPIELMHLEYQLESFIFGMRSNKQFSETTGISELAKRMVESKKHQLYPLVYLLLKLALLLPVAIPIVERVFSAMKIVKT